MTMSQKLLIVKPSFYWFRVLRKQEDYLSTPYIGLYLVIKLTVIFKIEQNLMGSLKLGKENIFIYIYYIYTSKSGVYVCLIQHQSPYASGNGQDMIGTIINI